MKLILLLVVIVLASIPTIWLLLFLALNDLSVPTLQIAKFKRILIIFPHADDEALTASGLMHKASLSGARVSWVILTQGERGNPTDTLDPKLKPIRVQEAKRVAELLNVTQVYQADFGDGQVMSKKKEIASFLKTILSKEKPDLVITYDLSGWYGHPDHIATTEVVNSLIKNDSGATHLWYVTLPKRVWTLTGGLPTQMAQSPDWRRYRTFPNGKVFIGANVLTMIQTNYTYKSQYQSLRSSFPFALIPMWFFMSMGWYEYFYQAI